MNKPTRKLTAKQEAFARAVASGMSLAAAYREAYDAENMSDAAIRNEASKLMANRGVTLMVSGLKAKKEEAVVACAVADADFVLRKLIHFADTATPQDAQKIRATELLGKTLGMFKEVQVNETGPRTSAEVREELRRYLQQIEQPTPAPNMSDTDTEHEHDSVH